MSAPSDDGRPPILGSWPRLYSLILALLAAWILLFYLFTVHFRPAP